MSDVTMSERFYIDENGELKDSIPCPPRGLGSPYSKPEGCYWDHTRLCWVNLETGAEIQDETAKADYLAGIWHGEIGMGLKQE